MLTMNRRSILKASAATVAVAARPNFSSAQTAFTPPSYTPDDLKGQLTPFGAVRAGNASGSIPAWTGGGYPMPAGYQQGDPRPIPFADEKPLYVITASNMAQYTDILSPALQAMFSRYPDFTMQVFPTHRTASAPQYVYDYIYKNAQNAQLSPDGQSVLNAYGGIPFPFPQNGNEVIWNNELAWGGVTAFFVADSHTITADGGIVFESRSQGWIQYPYYFENGEDNFQGFYGQLIGNTMAPPYEAGVSLLSIDPVNLAAHDTESWEYLVGQRRVRRAPELEYDTPNFLTGGTQNWDEGQIFSGKLNEYDFMYIGIKEMLVPYNTNKFNAAAIHDQFLTKFINPDLTRWELHRCRVVQMKVKPGYRNVDASRIVYADEDTGSLVLGEVYDAQGSLWKLLHAMPVVYGDVPCLSASQSYVVYDLHAGDYSCANHYDAETQPQWKLIPQLPPSFFTVGRLAAQAGSY
jgi:hypothetical protein